MAAQDEKLNQLMRSVHAGRIVHALLFVGPTGTGKKTAAFRLAQSIYCTSEPKPCGVCPACKRVLARSHPDLHILRPEKKNILVDDVRGLIDRLALKPYEGVKHIAIVEPVDRMNEQAQNALLKTLENPRDDVMFILVAERSSSLLPTILSRCQQLRFSPLSTSECAAVLTRKGIPSARAAFLAGLAEGSVGRAMELDRDEKWMSSRENALKALEAIRERHSVAEALSLLTGQKGDESVILDILQLWARDLMAVQNSAEPFEADDARRLRQWKLSGTKLLKAVIRARKMLASNVSWSNVASDMLLDLI